MKILLLMILLLIILSFKAESQTVVDLKSTVGKIFNQVLYSDLFSDIDYIQLETLPTCLIGTKFNISIIDSFILVTDLNSQFLFNKKNGKFITKIGNKGRGPGEYQSTKGLINNKEKRIYAIGWNSDFIEYELNGNYIGNIKIPGYVDNFSSPSIPGNYSILDNNFVCYYANCIGTETKLISFFNSEGEVLSTKKNFNRGEKYNFALSINESVFYHYNKKLYFNEIYNDTIFEIAPDYKKARYIIDAGKFRLNYYAKWKESSDKWQSYILNMNIMESDHYLFLIYYLKSKMHISVFNKTNNRIINVEKLNNDIDHFLSFVPITIINDSLLIGTIHAYEIATWFNNNPELSRKLPDRLHKYKQIDPSANPVVVIAKLKE